jgi:hypothetical protein
MSAQQDGWSGVGLVVRFTSTQEDKAEAHDLFLKLSNKEGTTEQAEQWLARLKAIAPRYFETHPGSNFDVAVKARRPYERLRARLGARLSKRQLMTLVRQLQRREGTEEEQEAWHWLVEESIPNATVSFQDDYRSPKEIIEHALATHEIIFGLDPAPTPRWQRALSVLVQSPLVTRLAAAQARRALRASRVSARFAAAQALRELGDRRAVAGLVRILKNRREHRRLRLAAMQALVGIGDERAVAPLVQVMLDQTEEGDLRKHSVWALNELGSLRARTPLVALLKDRREDVPLRSCAARSLSSIRGEEASTALLTVAADATDDSSVRSEALMALVDLSNPPAYRRPPC